MQVIGLTGFAGAGKSTVAEYLVKEYGFTRLSFAAPLKKMLRTLNPVIGNSPLFKTYEPYFYLSDLWDIAERICKDFPELSPEQWIKDGSWGPEYRRLLQVLGTDCIRSVDENFWVNAALKQITDADDKVVFDDVRFPNEAEVIAKLHPAGLWNISRPGFDAVNGHASEMWAGKMNERIWLHNGADIEGLQDQIDYALTAVTA